MKPSKVLLAFLPYGHIRFPALGASLLKAAANRRGFDCRVAYFNLSWVDRHFQGSPEVRFEHHYRLGNHWDLYHPAEACFAHLLFPSLEERCRRLVLGVGDPEMREELLHLWDRAEPFLEECVESEPWSEIAIVGFSSTFNQNLASLALAARLKRRFPHLVTVFGGPNAEGAMGEELCRSFPFVDHVFSGDSDHSFPLFVERFLAGSPLGEIPGLVGRLPDGRLSVQGARSVEEMDSLPYPDFDDYFSTLSETSLASSGPLARERSIPFESSRGCWWGAKHHCTFCGLNGYGMKFRSKSATRVLAELQHLWERYRPDRVSAMDNIMDHRYFRDVLPGLAALGLPIELSYDTKSNLGREEVRLFAEAGVREIEAGIESLSSASLARMKKGVTALQNIQAMRLAREYGVRLNWQHLYGFPGESFEEYRHIPELVPSLYHLEGPSADETSRISLQRYSPYFTKPRDFGIARIWPAPGYADVYDVGPEALANLAYRFEYELEPSLGGDPERIRTLLGPAIARWRERDSAGADLAFFRGPQESLVLDTREPEPRVWLLDAAASSLLRAADEIRGRSRLLEIAASPTEPGGPQGIPAGSIERARECLAEVGVPVNPIGLGASDLPWEDLLERLVRARLLVVEGKNVLSLALPRPVWVLERVLHRLEQGVLDAATP